MSTLLTAQFLRVDTAFGTLFDSLSFTLKKGDRIGLLGDNGCGKSTLLKVLDGTDSPAAGTVALAGHCLMARIEQHLPDAIFPLTMLDAVLAQLPLAERDSLRWKAETLLAGMGFTPQDMTLRSATLSGGQHTRLLLARALIHEPDLLLLDEPSNHLDLPTMLCWNIFYRTGQAASCWSRTTDSCWMPSQTAAGSCAIKRCTTLPFPARPHARRLKQKMKATRSATRRSKRRSIA